MVFRFLILSDEVDDFKREIKIDSEATFLDLYNAIMDSVGYTKDQMCSFFICDDDWSKNTEITLVEMDTSSEVDNYIMEDTRLEELLEDEHQKLLFVFQAKIWTKPYAANLSAKHLFRSCRSTKWTPKQVTPK